MNTVRIKEILDDCTGQADEDGRPFSGSVLVDVWENVLLDIDKVNMYEREMRDMFAPVLDQLAERPKDEDGQKVAATLDLKFFADSCGGYNTAFNVLAYGKQVGWWSVVTPQTALGISKGGVVDEDLILFGMVFAMGYPA